MNRLQNRVAVVTGGNTGIGRAVCSAFAAEGADVAIAWYEREAEAESLAEAIRAQGRRALPIHADITDEQQVESMIGQVTGELGRLDILVNNAGIQKAQPITEMSVADWDRMLTVHLRGAFLCSREAARVMIAQRSGRIINLCSQLGYIGRENYTAYSTAKGGMIAFTRALAKELAPHGILANGVAPGLVDTGFDPLSADAKQAHADALPLKRLGTPEDMTSAFVFLASDEGRYYCGQLLHPNGGEIMP
jgi:3-oxoacyl-[acyl-carrier protein] reductase